MEEIKKKYIKKNGSNRNCYAAQETIEKRAKKATKKNINNGNFDGEQTRIRYTREKKRAREPSKQCENRLNRSRQCFQHKKLRIQVQQCQIRLEQYRLYH